MRWDQTNAVRCSEYLILTDCRYFIKKNAQELGITGWVHNAEDGGVEAVFCGDKKKIEEMIALCRQGPMLADVKHFGFEWETPEVFKDFLIL